MTLKLPNSLHLPRLKTEPIKNIISNLLQYKLLIIISISLIAFIVVAMWYRGYLLSKLKIPSENAGNEVSYSTSTDKPSPTFDISTPSPSPSDSDVLGASDNSDYVYKAPLPLPTLPPTLPPLPTIDPQPIVTTTTTTTTNTSSTPNISSGNSNCTTNPNVPNSWFSDVYPNPPINSYSSSITLIVYIRDCFKNTAPVSDTLNISLSSGDPNTQVNGNNLPYSITTQNGQASFNVSSQVNGTVTLVIKDTTSSFTVTNINNNNPSVNFNISSITSSTPTPAPTLANTATPTPLQSNPPTPTATPLLSNTPTPIPTSGSN